MEKFFSNIGKKISWVQILFLCCIILLSICSFQVLSRYPAVEAKRIGIFLFAVGATTLIIAAIKKRTLKGNLWLLCDGAATLTLSVCLLSGVVFPFCFAVWQAALGIFKIFESRRLKEEIGVNSRGFLILGIAEAIWGAVLFIRVGAEDGTRELAAAIVTAFAVQMCTYALRYYFYPMMSQE